MPDCHDKKIHKHSCCQENRIFTEKINSYFPHKSTPFTKHENKILINFLHIFFQSITKGSVKRLSFNTQLNDQTVQFRIIYFSISTELNCSKYCYVSLTIQLKHQSFFHTQLNDQTALFQTIQFGISKQFKFQTILFDPLIGPYQVQPLRARVNLRAVAMKGYSAFLKAPVLMKPRHQII